MPAKRPRRSGLTGVELARAVDAIQALVDKSREEQAVNRDDPELEATFDDTAELHQLDDILKMLQSKADGPQVRMIDGMHATSYSFSNMTQDHLDKLGISASGLLELKPNAIPRAVQTDALGADSIWSSDMLCRHLQFLEGLVPRTNEAAARLWINAFFYRVAVMISSGSKMVLSVEQVVPSVTVSNTSAHTLSGYVVWTAIVMPARKAHIYLRHPFLQHLKNDESALFVSEAKGPNQLLQHHVPQAVGEMLACARTARKPIIRGVLTNGHTWIFIILKLSDNGGGSYFQSKELLITGLSSRISGEAVSVISAIISHWMVHSHEELDGEDDYFTIL
ncbi:hypothetical protein PUNSTDRAFT_139419 [Punctularia strigosozonata HHB-11173 SS5]|uniref:Uncharacterized protein n=1 Tax=Punctularia strigosozonata (strain HHB-11173) TaxID=741275 RepID=R7S107_PUNST|nr:uncharacterized protein PUNSTDRAFT_139419 [Punctularia strigosozonata HHB-11173 SS5]EIN03534.1 hypothetical protein PUNSTDRAFT_139419 [Punctularia strigosozonata HHB-11173 SS5]